MAAFLLVDWGMSARPIYPPTITPEIVSTLQTIVPKERIFTGSKTEKFSKDFYWYSPILKRLLEVASIFIRFGFCFASVGIDYLPS